MIPDSTGNQPQIGNDANSLGVRVRIETGDREDISVQDGFVSPGRYGMSVSSSVEKVNFYRIPRRFKGRLPAGFGVPSGNNKAICWRAGEGPFKDAPFATGLMFQNEPNDCDTHGVIAPDSRCLLAEYRDNIAATLSMWQAVPWPWEEGTT